MSWLESEKHLIFIFIMKKRKYIYIYYFLHKSHISKFLRLINCQRKQKKFHIHENIMEMFTANREYNKRLHLVQSDEG